MTPAPFALPALPAGFAEQHPGVTVRLIEDETASLQAALLSDGGLPGRAAVERGLPGPPPPG